MASTAVSLFLSYFLLRKVWVDLPCVRTKQLIHFTKDTSKIYKFHYKPMVVQVTEVTNGDLARTNRLPTLRFKPMTFTLASCQEIAFLSGKWISDRLLSLNWLHLWH